MRAIVRSVNLLKKRFCAESSEDGTWAAFEVVRGGFPFGGEFIRWNELTKPVTMIIGESSGTLVVGEHILAASRDEAYKFIEP
jgi:hypothetical protein